MKVLMIGPSQYMKGGISSLLNNYNKELSYFNDKGINTKFLPTIKEENAVLENLTTFFFTLIYIILQGHKYDLAHIHVSSDGSFIRKYLLSRVCRMKKINYITHLHSGRFEGFYNKSNFFFKRSIIKFFSESKKNIVLGEEHQKLISEISNDKTKQIILYNSVSPVEVNKEDNKNRRNFVIGFLGDLVFRKGIDDLLSVVDQIEYKKETNIKLLLAGKDLENNIDMKINALTYSNRVSYLGWINGKEKKEFFSKIDVFVLPSYSEGMPMSILEALSCGKPVISTNVGSINKLIKDEKNGFLIEPGNQNELMEALVKMLNCDQLKLEMGKQSYYIYVNQLSIKAHIDTLNMMYINSINQRY